jgi:hypothetical protein
MIYRKAPLRPTRFLLKVVTAGAGAMLSVACSSSGVDGSVVGAVDSGGDVGDGGSWCDPSPCGLVDAGLMTNPEAGDEHEPMGVVANPEAGDENTVVGLVDAGLVANPEAGDENEPMGVIDAAVGVVANPEAGHD